MIGKDPGFFSSYTDSIISGGFLFLDEILCEALTESNETMRERRSGSISNSRFYCFQVHAHTRRHEAHAREKLSARDYDHSGLLRLFSILTITIILPDSKRTHCVSLYIDCSRNLLFHRFREQINVEKNWQSRLQSISYTLHHLIIVLKIMEFSSVNFATE